MKNLISNLCFVGLFLLVFTTQSNAQGGLTPTQKTALTTACEICTKKTNAKPLTDVEKRQIEALDKTRLRWCPQSCTLLEKVNTGVGITSKDVELIEKIRRTLELSNQNASNPSRSNSTPEPAKN